MKIRLLLAVGLVPLLAVLAACGSDGADDAASGEALTGGRTAGDAGVAYDTDDADEAEEPEVEPHDGEEGAGFAGAGAPGDTPLPRQASARSGERVIKDGTMTIEVGEGGFLQAYRRVIDTALDLGGHLTDSTSTSTPGGGTSGSVTVRVPVERYEDLLTGVGQIGTLRSQQISSRDVTAEFTDLESRLRHLRAQEAFYLELLEEADGVQDAIAVKQHLDGIQSQVEQAQGRLNVLEDRTSYSTLTVEVVEPGTQPVVAAGPGKPMLSEYWQRARDGFVTVVGWLLVSLVSMAPLLVPLVVVGIAWRLTRRRAEVAATVAPDR